jgi:NAD(P)-dependent dehydrogenase (short-subunit alcohol dehydrogenase family)
LQRLASELSGALAVPTDMRDPEAVRRMVAQPEQHYGRIDVLINNAGQGQLVPIEQASIEEYRSIFELNAVGVLVAMQAVIPVMRKLGGGVMVNISFGTTKIVRPGIGPYVSTKHALNSLTLTARQELAADNIRVGLVYPGLTETAFFSNLTHGQSSGWNSGGTRPGGIPIDTPEQVAERILEAVQTEAAEVYAHTIRPNM